MTSYKLTLNLPQIWFTERNGRATIRLRKSRNIMFQCGNVDTQRIVKGLFNDRNFLAYSLLLSYKFKTDCPGFCEKCRESKNDTVDDFIILYANAFRQLTARKDQSIEVCGDCFRANFCIDCCDLSIDSVDRREAVNAIIEHLKRTNQTDRILAMMAYNVEEFFIPVFTIVKGKSLFD